jgi:cytochrome c
MNKRRLLIVCLLLGITACSQESSPPASGGSAPKSASTEALETTEPVTSAKTEEKAGIVAEAISIIKRDTTDGAKLTRKKCASCHYLDRNLRKVGPTLKGIYGRKPSISDIPYEVWDEAALDAWLEDPKQVKPKTKMAIPGMKDADERQAIIDYLKQL